MGCDSSLDNIVHLNEFKVKLYIPNSDSFRMITHSARRDRIPITELINLFFFTSKTESDLDANFISVYNKKTEAFDYYIQRIAGFEMENEDNPSQGKMWFFYLNNEKTDWTQICRDNKVIHYKDDLELRYDYGTSNQNNAIL